MLPIFQRASKRPLEHKIRNLLPVGLSDRVMRTVWTIGACCRALRH
jgi:hypothetical protein